MVGCWVFSYARIFSCNHSCETYDGPTADDSDHSLQEIATAEGKKAALEMSARAVREEHEHLQKELETVQLSVEAAKADVATAQRELRTLRDKVYPLL